MKRKIATAALLGAMALSIMGIQIASSVHAARSALGSQQTADTVPLVPPIGPPP
jgi:uncharacterized membrane protein